MVTIGKHSAIDGFRTCFIDALRLAEGPRTFEIAVTMNNFLITFARSCECTAIIGDTPSKSIAKIGKQLGYAYAPMYKIWRFI